MDLEINENTSKIYEISQKFQDMIILFMNYFIISCIYLKKIEKSSKCFENVRMFEKNSLHKIAKSFKIYFENVKNQGKLCFAARP